MATVQYFDRRGRELSQWEATDSRGILYDGVTVRVRKMMRDSAGSPKRQVVDARHPNDPLALSRPGFRISRGNSLDDTLAQVGLADAYRQQEEYLNTAWRNPAPLVRKPIADGVACPDCGGTGEIDGAQCERCDGEGEIDDEDYEQNDSARHVDHRSSNLDAMRCSHALNMTRIYDQIEHDLQNAWRGGNK